MELPAEAIEEFKMIYQKKYGILLRDEEASKLALDVYDFYKVVARPVDKRIIKSMKMKKSV